LERTNQKLTRSCIFNFQTEDRMTYLITTTKYTHTDLPEISLPFKTKDFQKKWDRKASKKFWPVREFTSVGNYIWKSAIVNLLTKKITSQADRFLSDEIRFRISRLIAKPKSRFYITEIPPTEKRRSWKCKWVKNDVKKCQSRNPLCMSLSWLLLAQTSATFGYSSRKNRTSRD